MTTYQISLDGAGADTAWDVTELQALMTASADGDTWEIDAADVYPVLATSINWSKRIKLKGKYQTGEPGWANIVGNRSWPWPANGMWTNSGQYVAAVEGKTPFLLKTGGDGSEFEFIAAKHLQHFLRASLNDPADHVGVFFRRHHGFNCSVPVLYTASNANGIVDVEIEDSRCVHYSVAGIRTWGSVRRMPPNTNRHGTVFDSRRQFHTPGTFPFAVHIHDFIQGVQTSRPIYDADFFVDLNNAPIIPADASPPPSDSYGQGDGAVTEEAVLLSTLRRGVVKGNADRGFDSKAEADIEEVYFADNGFGVANHAGGVKVALRRCFVGTPKRLYAPADNVSCLQASGLLEVRSSVIECLPGVGASPADHAKYQVVRGDTNGSGTQSGQLTPFRSGKIKVHDSVMKRLTDIVESNLSIGAENGRTIPIIGLTPASVHEYTVRPINASGVEGTNGPPKSVTIVAAFTGGDTGAPTTPGQPDAASITSTSVDLTWTGSTDDVGVSGYAIYLDGVICALAETTAWRISNLVPGTTYSVQVAAYDFQNNVSALSAARSVTTAAGSPANPAMGAGPAISAIPSTSIGPTWVLLTWATVANAVAYRVYDSGVLVAHTFKGANVTPTFEKSGVKTVLV